MEYWKAHFQEFDSFLGFQVRTDRILVSSFSSVFLVPRNRIKLLKMNFPIFDQSLP